MRALEISSPHVVSELSVPIPDIEKDEALIRVAFSGICATDYEILGGEMTLVREGKIRYPVRFGHEWSGVIVKTGDGVASVHVGDRVVSDPGIACGKCPACRQQRYSDCPNIRSLGTINCWDGSFADYIRIPERHLYKLPDSIGLQEAALIEPAGIACEAIRKIDCLEGNIALIVGTGAIGMASVAFAKHCGASRVILAGRTDEKLEIGRQIGADRVVNVRKQSLKDAICEETNGAGVYCVIETTGNIEAVNQCLELAKDGGTVVYVGFYDHGASNFPIDALVSKELNVFGVMGHFGTARDVIKAMEEGLNLKPIITHEIPFDQARNTMLNPQSLQGPRIKVLVNMS